MQVVSADAQGGVPALVDRAQHEPVTIERNGRPVAVVLAVEEYERLNEAEEREMERLCRELDEKIAKGFASGAGRNLSVEEMLEWCKQEWEAGRRYGPPR
jgi:prevent-host-death family protein